MRNLQWHGKAWEEYIWWQQEDRKILKRINTLIREVQRHPFEGTGKPEPLKGNFSGFWSRRIDQENRLIYTVIDTTLVIVSCKGHYDKQCF